VHARWTTWVFAAVAAAGALPADPARADCPVTLIGDPDTVGRVARALAAFGGEDGACVSLRATCSADPEHLGGIVVELQDAFGRAAHRTVASVDGAVALLVSWSRRPVPLSPPGATPPQPAIAAAPPTAEATLTAHAEAAPVPAPILVDPRVDQPPRPVFAHDRQLELRVAVIGAPAEGQVAYDVDAAFVRRNGILRYGVDLRTVATTGGDRFLYTPEATYDMLTSLVSLDASGVLGVVIGTGRLLGHAEVALGGAVIGGTANGGKLVYQTQGLHVGARAAVDLRLAGTLWLELGAGWDGLRHIGPSGDESVFLSDWATTPHLDAGFMWVL
jgi:hypothetical protein